MAGAEGFEPSALGFGVPRRHPTSVGWGHHSRRIRSTRVYSRVPVDNREVRAACARSRPRPNDRISGERFQHFREVLLSWLSVFTTFLSIALAARATFCALHHRQTKALW